MSFTDIAIVILAAGKGKRMKSELPKVLHKIDSKSMVEYVVQSAVAVAGKAVYVVVGHQAEKVRKAVSDKFDVSFVYQEALLGTGDAVKTVMPVLPPAITTVVVLCGDVPMIKRQTITELIAAHTRENNSMTLLGVELDNPHGYGRIIQNRNGRVIRIKEEADASDEEKRIRMINAGIYCFEKTFLSESLPAITSNNNQQEYYLTDMIRIAAENNHRIGFVNTADKREVMGINTLGELEMVTRMIGGF